MPKPFDPYRPSNGSEGCSFECFFCDKCSYGGKCPIWAAANCNDIGDENYPSQLIYDKNDKPTCTAFVLLPDWALLKNKQHVVTRTADFKETIAEVDADALRVVTVEIAGSCGECTFDIVNVSPDPSNECLLIEVERNF